MRFGAGMSHSVEDLPVFSKAHEFCLAVSAILAGSTLRHNSKAYERIEDANHSIVANLEEGFHQSSHEGFARSLGYARGSVAEVIRRVRRARTQGHVASDDVGRASELADQLDTMLAEFITYLKRSGVTDR